ncbi:MAG: hypothetical protein ACUVQ0_02580 [Thermoproteota archaeon]
MKLVIVLAVLILVALSPIPLIDFITPSKSIPYSSEDLCLEIPVSGLNNSPWVYALGISIPGYGIGTIASQGKSLVEAFTRYFNTQVWSILCIVIIVAICLVASMSSDFAFDAIRASVLSIIIVSAIGLYFLHTSLKPVLYEPSFSLPQTVVEDAVATLSLMIFTGTLINIIVVAIISGVLTRIVIIIRPRVIKSMAKPQAVEKPTEVKTSVKEEKPSPLRIPPLCPRCGSELVWKPEESRYFCEKCKSYPEDIYFKT